MEDPGTESRYSVYLVGWVNPDSERTTEILLSAVGGIRTHNLLIDSPAFTTELSPLCHRLRDSHSQNMHDLQFDL